jgi:hypothetical protein
MIKNTIPGTKFQLGWSKGNLKNAMKDVGAGRRDTYFVSPENLHVKDGFNVRFKDADLEAHIQGLMDSIESEGFHAYQPLGGYVANEDGIEVIYVTEGHCRLEAVKRLVKKGIQFEGVPVVISSGITEESITLGLLTSNSGKSLKPLEQAVVVARLVNYGWEKARIAKSAGFTVTYLDQLLQLLESPAEVREMVKRGEVSAATAIKVVRKSGSAAAGVLKEGLATAKAKGKAKVTEKHLAGAKGVQKVTKLYAEDLYEGLLAVQADAGISALQAVNRNRIKALLAKINDELDAA